MKKPAKQGRNHASSSENPHTKHSKPKCPCIVCKGNHYHQDFPCILCILREWSPHLHHSVSSTSSSEVDSIPSASENKVNGHVIFPCGLCEGNHTLPCCPFLDEAKSILDNRPASPQWLFHLDTRNSCQVLH